MVSAICCLIVSAEQNNVNAVLWRRGEFIKMHITSGLPAFLNAPISAHRQLYFNAVKVLASFKKCNGSRPKKKTA